MDPAGAPRRTNAACMSVSHHLPGYPAQLPDHTPLPISSCPTAPRHVAIGHWIGAPTTRLPTNGVAYHPIPKRIAYLIQRSIPAAVAVVRACDVLELDRASRARKSSSASIVYPLHRFVTNWGVLPIIYMHVYVYYRSKSIITNHRSTRHDALLILD